MAGSEKTLEAIILDVAEDGHRLKERLVIVDLGDGYQGGYVIEDATSKPGLDFCPFPSEELPIVWCLAQGGKPPKLALDTGSFQLGVKSLGGLFEVSFRPQRRDESRFMIVLPKFARVETLHECAGGVDGEVSRRSSFYRATSLEDRLILEWLLIEDADLRTLSLTFREIECDRHRREFPTGRVMLGALQK